MGQQQRCACDAWMEVRYRDRTGDRLELDEAVGWLSQHRQVLAAGEEVDLGQGNTPLTGLRSLAPNLLLKDESANPTWSHKDRVNGTNAAVAQLRAAPGLVAQTTGNHGASVAAFAAAAGCGSVILCRPGTPVEICSMIWAYGGIPVSATAAEILQLLPELVAAGYHPSTALDTPGAGCRNPYGVEAYKRICWEIVVQLGAVPDAVLVPTASGDTFYGVAKGFAELQDLTGARAPLVVAVQPEQANPLERSAEVDRVVEMPEADSLALSIANARTGGNGLAALRRWRSTVISVSESDITTATADLHRVGHFLEPASAAALAGYRATIRTGTIRDDQQCVLLGTASATKWLSRQADRLKQAPLATRQELVNELRHRDWPPIADKRMAGV